MNASHPTRTVNKKRIRKAVGFPGIQSSFQHELMKIQRDTQEETLMQVSEELHDNIGQLLALTKVYLGIAERTLPDPQHILKTANSTLSKATRDLRLLSRSLNKEWLSQFNMIENLHAEVDRINGAGILCAKFTSSVNQLTLSAELQVDVFRIIQESIQNIIKHANARNIDIRITQDTHLEIAIVDDGVGCNLHESKNDGIGIMNMKRRTAMLGGNINWQSQLGQGTEVRVEIPFPDKK